MPRASEAGPWYRLFTWHGIDMNYRWAAAFKCIGLYLVEWELAKGVYAPPKVTHWERSAPPSPWLTTRACRSHTGINLPRNSAHTTHTHTAVPYMFTCWDQSIIHPTKIHIYHLIKIQFLIIKDMLTRSSVDSWLQLWHVKKNPHTNLQNADICTAVRMQRVCGPDAANDNKM